MSDVRTAGIQYQPAGRVFDFDASDLELSRGDLVVVETDRGPAVAAVAFEPETGPRKGRKLKRILRKATLEDVDTAAQNRERAEKAIRIAVERARYYKLPIKMVTADFTLKGNRAVFYFSAEDRVDYRALVKDLSHELGAKVEFRQIGPRDVSKSSGGIGPCGRELCCSSWLREFQPVSIKMAKDQGLALNPQKVSGQCGRLLCCLSYEHEGYVENKQGMPKVGKRVETPDGDGRVTSVDILNRVVRVQLLDDQSHQTYKPEDVKQLRGPQPRREDKDAKDSRGRGRRDDKDRKPRDKRSDKGKAAKSEADKSQADKSQEPKPEKGNDSDASNDSDS